VIDEKLVVEKNFQEAKSDVESLERQRESLKHSLVLIVNENLEMSEKRTEFETNLSKKEKEVVELKGKILKLMEDNKNMIEKNKQQSEAAKESADRSDKAEISKLRER
jgi:chromosome segregation ATPase